MDELNIPGKIPKPIRKWNCHKLECFADYIEAYAKTLKNTECCYIGLYSGCGSCTCKDTDCRIEDSELRVLKTRLAKYIFVVRNPQDAENLKRLTKPYNTDSNIEIITGNCIREKVIRQVFDLIPRSASSFAFVDPSGYKGMRWATIKKLTAHGSDWKGHKIELLIVFPLEMALLRNLTRPECEASITRLYGSRKWLEIKQAKLDGKIELSELRHRLVKLFKAGLKGLGYKYVEDFEPARFANPPFYHLILASDSGTKAKILKDAWGKPRYLPCELLYKKES
ncbi:MAG: three-Cys-motif partner protein TcmP [Dehalococcoidales bacterium]